MLTKSQIKYTIRGDKVFPKYIKPNDAKYLRMADQLIRHFESSVGVKYAEVELGAKGLISSGDSIGLGFVKLLLERASFQEPLSIDMNSRLKWLLISKELRQDGVTSYQEFVEKVSRKLELNFENISLALFSDLDEFKTLVSFEKVEPESLIDRYNLAQIQGLLLKANSLRFMIDDPDVNKKRRLLQKLKFFNLLFDMQEVDRSFRFEISGPLSIFDQSQSYGVRLSNFLPYILLFDEWSMEAEILVREKNVQLSIDSEKKIRSHYNNFSGYIPEEFSVFKRTFLDLKESERKGWSLLEDPAVLSKDPQDFFIPDLSFVNQEKRKLHIELFHKWHKSEVLRRLRYLRASNVRDYGVGISQDLIANDEIKEIFHKLKDEGKKVFTFRQFPTIKAILAQLEGH